jgi:hypothetical protein
VPGVRTNSTLEALVAAMFAGPKADLRPLYERLLQLGLGLGDDIRACPCKKIVPLYRRHVSAEINPSYPVRIVGEIRRCARFCAGDRRDGRRVLAVSYPASQTESATDHPGRSAPGRSSRICWTSPESGSTGSVTPASSRSLSQTKAVPLGLERTAWTASRSASRLGRAHHGRAGRYHPSQHAPPS